MSKKTVPTRRVILKEYFFYFTLLCLTVLSLRMVLTGNYYFYFLPWNLLLGLLPMFFAYKATESRNRHNGFWWSIFWTIVWLFFFPNALYIVTDFLHLLLYDDVDLVTMGLANLYGAQTSVTPNWIFWYDVFTIALFSFTAWVAGLCSFQMILTNHRLLVDKNWKQATFFVASVFLTGFGIFLGRFLRFNSWDVILQPLKIVREVWGIFLYGPLFQMALATTMSFVVSLIVTYVVFDKYFVFSLTKKLKKISR